MFRVPAKGHLGLTPPGLCWPLAGGCGAASDRRRAHLDRPGPGRRHRGAALHGLEHPVARLDENSQV